MNFSAWWSFPSSWVTQCNLQRNMLALFCDCGSYCKSGHFIGRRSEQLWHFHMWNYSSMLIRFWVMWEEPFIIIIIIIIIIILTWRGTKGMQWTSMPSWWKLQCDCLHLCLYFVDRALTKHTHQCYFVQCCLYVYMHYTQTTSIRVNCYTY